jgi:hypothetical protein
MAYSGNSSAFRLTEADARRLIVAIETGFERVADEVEKKSWANLYRRLKLFVARFEPVIEVAK